MWWGNNDKDLIGKSIKDIELTYASQAEMFNAKKRNIILAAALGILLAVFFLASVLGDRPSSTVSPGQQDNTPSGSIGTVEEPSGDPLPGNDSGLREKAPIDLFSVLRLEVIEFEGGFAKSKANEPYAADPYRMNEVATISHQIVYGEDFSTISVLYYNTDIYAGAIAAFNNMALGDMLYVGYYLLIPVDPTRIN